MLKYISHLFPPLLSLLGSNAIGKENPFEMRFLIHVLKRFYKNVKEEQISEKKLRIWDKEYCPLCLSISISIPLEKPWGYFDESGIDGQNQPDFLYENYLCYF